MYKVFPLRRNKVLFLVSHDINRNENIGFIEQELRSRWPDCECIFLTRSDYALGGSGSNVWKTFLKALKLFLVQSYHLATAKTVIAENFFFPSAYFTFKKAVKVIQVWHSSIAFKKFGLDSDGNDVEISDKIRKITRQYTHVVVNSEKIKPIFAQAFGVGLDQVVVTGNPRTDFYFDPELIREARQRFESAFRSRIRGRKVLIYAPTFRDHELNSGTAGNPIKLAFNIDQLYETLRNDYVLLIKLHPRIGDRLDMDRKYHDFLIDVSHYPNLNDLLVASDVLITDYSSIILEFALMGKPIIFYPYDLEEYDENRGFYYNYKKYVPGPIVYDTAQLIRLIQQFDFDLERVVQFAAEHQPFTDGKSSRRLVDLMSL